MVLAPHVDAGDLALQRGLEDDFRASRVVRLEESGSLRADLCLLAGFGLLFVSVAGWRLRVDG